MFWSSRWARTNFKLDYPEGQRQMLHQAAHLLFRGSVFLARHVLSRAWVFDAAKSTSAATFHAPYIGDAERNANTRRSRMNAMKLAAAIGALCLLTGEAFAQSYYSRQSQQNRQYQSMQQATQRAFAPQRTAQPTSVPAPPLQHAVAPTADRGPAGREPRHNQLLRLYRLRRRSNLRTLPHFMPPLSSPRPRIVGHLNEVAPRLVNRPMDIP